MKRSYITGIITDMTCHWRPRIQSTLNNCVNFLLHTVTDCLAPYIEDADVFNKTYKTGDKLTMSCREGFQTRYPDFDNMASICQDDGTWENLPLCQGVVMYLYDVIYMV